MTFRRRSRRPDDWATDHARAQAALSDRLDGELEPEEAEWLDGHLAGCADCRAAAVAYETQHSELRAMRDQQPIPPRDLWARTAAAIEHESRFRDQEAASGGPRRRRIFIPVFAAALVVAVVVGTLTSSRLLVDGGPTALPDAGASAASGGPASSDVAFATPIPVGQHVQWISRDADGSYHRKEADVRAVCPNENDPCAAAAPVQDQPVDFAMEPQTVFGSANGQQLIVVNRPGTSEQASIAVVDLAPAPSPTPSPSHDASPTPSATPDTTASPTVTPTPPASADPSKTPATSPSTAPSATPTPSDSNTETPPPSATPPISPTPSVEVSPSTSPGGTVQIAKDVVIVGQSAAYSPSGEWFAFTARPADGSAGPDIYVWKVGDKTARAITTDHRSAFGSWALHDRVVGSSTSETGDAATGDRSGASFVMDPGTGETVSLPQTGSTWRPSVDPNERRAVYWTGSLRRADGSPVDLPADGRLVIGDWTAAGVTASGAPDATPLTGNQEEIRHETTIASGPITDWDARWDTTGSKLAVWIADPHDASVGTLSLYDVDPFDGRVDLKKPLLDAQRATAGFAISDGKLVWAEPAADGTGRGRILVLAWTDQGAGTIETLPDNVYVIR